MKSQLNIESIKVLRGNAADAVFVTFSETLMSPIWPFEPKKLEMRFNAAHGKGAAWCIEHLGIEPTVTEVL